MAKKSFDLWELLNISIVPPTQCSIGIGRDLPNRFFKDTNSNRLLDWWQDRNENFALQGWTKYIIWLEEMVFTLREDLIFIRKWQNFKNKKSFIVLDKNEVLPSPLTDKICKVVHKRQPSIVTFSLEHLDFTCVRTFVIFICDNRKFFGCPKSLICP